MSLCARLVLALPVLAVVGVLDGCCCPIPSSDFSVGISPSAQRLKELPPLSQASSDVIDSSY